MAASHFRPPKLNRKSRKGLQNKPLTTYTVSGCYCSHDVAARHAKVVLGLADTGNP